MAIHVLAPRAAPAKPRSFHRSRCFNPATKRTWPTRSARPLDAREPLSEESAQEFRLLVGQGVSRVVDHGERGVRVVVKEVGSGGIPDRRVQPPRHDQCRTGVCRRVIGGEGPPLADSLERRLVDERCGRRDVTLYRSSISGVWITK
jgi:hypothetical protein